MLVFPLCPSIGYSAKTPTNVKNWPLSALTPFGGLKFVTKTMLIQNDPARQERQGTGADHEAPSKWHNQKKKIRTMPNFLSNWTWMKPSPFRWRQGNRARCSLVLLLNPRGVGGISFLGDAGDDQYRSECSNPALRCAPKCTCILHLVPRGLLWEDWGCGDVAADPYLTGLLGKFTRLMRPRFVAGKFFNLRGLWSRLGMHGNGGNVGKRNGQCRVGICGISVILMGKFSAWCWSFHFLGLLPQRWRVVQKHLHLLYLISNWRKLVNIFIRINRKYVLSSSGQLTSTFFHHFSSLGLTLFC